MNKEYNFERSSRKSLLLFLLLFIVIFGIAMFIVYSNVIFGIPLTPVYLIGKHIVVFIIIISPFLFIKKLRKTLNKRESVGFNDNYIDVTEYDSINNLPLEHYAINWKDILDYRYYYDSKSKFHNIVLHLQNGKIKYFLLEIRRML